MQIIIPRSSALASAAGEDIAQEEGNTACPICLAPPTAPRMTKCGHVRRPDFCMLINAHISSCEGLLLSMHTALSQYH